MYYCEDCSEFFELPDVDSEGKDVCPCCCSNEVSDLSNDYE